MVELNYLFEIRAEIQTLDQTGRLLIAFATIPVLVVCLRTVMPPTQAYLLDLPEELLLECFKYLDHKSLVHCTGVSSPSNVADTSFISSA